MSTRSPKFDSIILNKRYIVTIDPGEFVTIIGKYDRHTNELIKLKHARFTAKIPKHRQYGDVVDQVIHYVKTHASLFANSGLFVESQPHTNSTNCRIESSFRAICHDISKSLSPRKVKTHFGLPCEGNSMNKKHAVNYVCPRLKESEKTLVNKLASKIKKREYKRTGKTQAHRVHDMCDVWLMANYVNDHIDDDDNNNNENDVYVHDKSDATPIIASKTTQQSNVTIYLLDSEGDSS